MEHLEKILERIVIKEKWTIRAFVAQEAMKIKPECIYNFFVDLWKKGCTSWMIESLAHQTQTHKFFDKYYYEIMQIVIDLEIRWHIFKIFDWDLKNRFAWIWFEVTAMSIAKKDLGLVMY